MKQSIVAAAVGAGFLLSSCTLTFSEPGASNAAPATEPGAAVAQPEAGAGGNGTSAPVTIDQALQAWATRIGLDYQGPCATADSNNPAYCSIPQGDGVFVLGPAASEVDSMVGFRQDDKGNWVYDFDRPLERPPVGESIEGEDARIEHNQVSCIYENDAQACKALTDLGMGVDTNYGVGNSMTQTPNEIVIKWCQDGSGLACAEAALRGLSVS